MVIIVFVLLVDTGQSLGAGGAGNLWMAAIIQVRNEDGIPRAGADL